MIAFPAGMRVWIAGGVTDMRRGMNTLALQVQQGLGRDPHAGEIFCFRGRRGDLVKLLWHDGVGMSLYTKRLEAGKFIWPASTSGAAVPIFRPFETLVRPFGLPVRPMPGTGVWALIWPFARLFRGVLIAVGVLSVVSAAIGLAVVWALAFVVDGVTSQATASCWPTRAS
ncbi:IS66 family insertion sequence element accessory protein TnpB [Jannaschia seohaensis]|uniref:Transposase n=1 Tax=Jannaschia seohaensis TaxID=475081 RepID=A0A2Y9BA64_9RHOB|nr:IS66 family insertion sequence element accessory protein TnpB [Jannaschia seohaensis]PWJ09938.1 transposase [Jannaschia seohaensis]SSA51917.1 Transposase [Jannaschia seohaensis]